MCVCVCVCVYMCMRVFLLYCSRVNDKIKMNVTKKNFFSSKMHTKNKSRVINVYNNNNTYTRWNSNRYLIYQKSPYQFKT